MQATQMWRQVADQTDNGDDAIACGYSAYQCKDYETAIRYLKMGLDNSSKSNAWICYNIACCYGLLEDKDKALEWFEQSVDYGFSYLLTARNDTDLTIITDTDTFKTLTLQYDTSEYNREDGWRKDLDLLVEMIENIAYAPYERYSKEEIMTLKESISTQIPNLSRYQIAMQFMKLVAMVGDGHTAVDIFEFDDIKDYQLPLDFFLEDGQLYIVSTTPEHADLLGQRLVEINEDPINQILESIAEIISYDNLWGKNALLGYHLRYTTILYGLGLIDIRDDIVLTVKDEGGKTTKVPIPTLFSGSYKDYFFEGDAIHLVPKNADFWYKRSIPYYFKVSEEKEIVYCQFNSIRSMEDYPFDEFITDLFDKVNENSFKLVLDLRWNGGGDTSTLLPFLHQLIKSNVNEKGKLFVFISRHTYSAAMNLSTYIERHTEAIFVGEPTASKPNFVGETVLNELPYSGLIVSISNLYWQSSWPFDHRQCIYPDILAPFSVENLRKGIDMAYNIVEEFYS